MLISEQFARDLETNQAHSCDRGGLANTPESLVCLGPTRRKVTQRVLRLFEFGDYRDEACCQEASGAHKSREHGAGLKYWGRKLTDRVHEGFRALNNVA